MHYDRFIILCILFAQGCVLSSECVLIFIVFHFKAPVDCMHAGESHLWPNCFVVIIVCCMSAIFLLRLCVFARNFAYFHYDCYLVEILIICRRTDVIIYWLQNHYATPFRRQL